MTDVQDPIREQLVEARRNQILDAAAQVFAEKGFHRATIKEIAGAAGVSEGTIYNYFDSKDGLLIGLMSRLAELESLDSDLMEALAGEPRDFFIGTFHTRLERIRQGTEILQAILPEVLVNPELQESFYQQYVLRIATMMEQYIAAQIELGRIRPVDVPLTVRAFQGMFVGLLVFYILGDETIRDRWSDIPGVFATLVFDGLRPPEKQEV